MKRVLLLLLGMIALFAGIGCQSQHAATFGLENGYYSTQLTGAPARRVFIHRQDEDIIVQRPGMQQSDTLPLNAAAPVRPAVHFFHQSFDIDVLTAPFKYRPSADGFPRLLQTTFSGKLYLGYRTDIYRINYVRYPPGGYMRSITHFGFSLGLIGGLGSTPVNPWVTNPAISDEYDGLVLTAGTAAIMALNNFSVGVAIGFDHLTDQHRDAWRYQHKPWAGLIFGLNLN